MKRLVAKRRLRRRCCRCDHNFKKGEVYYKQRNVCADSDRIYASEFIICPKCIWKQESHAIRYMIFKITCKHPKKFISTSYRYIPGEAVKEPDYDYCTLCGNKV